MARAWLGWFGWRGRLRRRAFILRLAAVTAGFVTLFIALQTLAGPDSTLLLYPPFFLALASLGVRRLHDQARSAWWLLVPIVPVLGPLLLGWRLLLTRGTPGANQHGADPRVAGYDYLQVAIHEPA